MRGRFTIALSVLLILVLIAALALFVAVNPALLRLYRADVVQPVLLMIGLVVLIGVLVATTRIFAQLRLADPTQPLGLPEGTVRAVIALALVLIFALMVVYLYGAIAYPLEIVSPAIPASSLASLPPGQIVRLDPVPGSSPLLYNVTLAAPKSTASDNFALQALTTVSTLAVAVASFYFGSQTTRAGTQAGVAAASGARILLSSPSPMTLARRNGALEPVDIRLDVNPASADVTGAIVAGDASGKLVRVGPRQFLYTPGEPSADFIALRFSLTDQPDVNLDVVLQVPPIE